MNLHSWLKRSIDAVLEAYSVLFFLLLILYGLGWFKWGMRTYHNDKIIGNLAVYLLLYYFYGCLFTACLRFIGQNKFSLKDCLINIKSFFSYVLVELINLFVCLAGLILFIIPGFFFAVKFSMSRLIVLHENKGALFALKKSYLATHGHTLYLSTILIPVIMMQLISRFSAHPLMQMVNGNVNIPLLTVSLVLVIVAHFIILPLTCMALVIAYDEWSLQQDNDVIDYTKQT